MTLFQNRILQSLAALLALLVFSGDVLDDVWYVPGSTTTQSSDQGKGTAPTNGSASHDDTVVISTPVGAMIPALPSALRYADIDEDAPDGAPASIDHPPQLS
jgi:hypothetical protein